MSIKVIVNGASGKMGTIACETFNKTPDFELVASLGRTDSLTTNMANHHPDIVVDLTSAKCVYNNTRTIIEAGIHPIIGTSGLLPTQVEELQLLCKKTNLGGIIVPNFSLGAILMMRFAADAAQYFSSAEIIEAHHPLKHDAPSGTAVKTAEVIAKHRRAESEQNNTHELIPGARGAEHQHVQIHALRLPGFLAQQQVIFGGTGETLSIIHNSIDRSCFMPGLLFACRKVRELNELVYGLESLL